MALEPDTYEQFRDYTHPERVVSGAWLYARLGVPELKVVESDEDSLLYDIGHIPTAVRIDWAQDLSEPRTRDYITAEEFAGLMRSKGISENDTVVIYGDHANSWAAYTFWVFTLFGHKDVRILDGGRDAWIAEERDTSYLVPEPMPTHYPVPERDDVPFRALVKDVHRSLGRSQILDVREADEYLGESSTASGYSLGSMTRTGHIPTAVNVSWQQAVHANSRFRSRAELEKLYQDLDPTADTITYCHHGDRAAHTWFVLKYLLGYDKVRSYDGSWVEWANMVGMPIVQREKNT